MILSGGGRVRGRGLGGHLDRGETEVRVFGATAAETARPRPSRGLIATEIEEQIAELWAGASLLKTSSPLYHIHCDPRWQDPELIAEFWRLFEIEFGLMNARFASSQHSKGDRGDHEHRVYDITLPNGKVINMKNDFYRRDKLAVIACRNLNRPFPAICHLAAVAKALRKEGLHDIAQWVESQPRRPRPVMPVSPAERQAADRTGSDKAVVANGALAAWQSSDNGASFLAALATRGLALAQGREVPVVVDEAGIALPLGRLLGEVSHTAGTRIRAATVRARLAGIDLPTEAEVRRRRRAAEQQAAQDEQARRLAAEAEQRTKAERAVDAEKQKAATAAAARASAEAAIGALIEEGRRAVAALAALEHERSRPPPWLRSIRRTARRARAAAFTAVAAHNIAAAEVASIGAARPTGWRGVWSRVMSELRGHEDPIAEGRARAEAAQRNRDTKAGEASVAAEERAGRQKAWQAQMVAERAVRREDLQERVDWSRAAIAALHADHSLATAPEVALRKAVRRHRMSRIAPARPSVARTPKPR